MADECGYGSLSRKLIREIKERSYTCQTRLISSHLFYGNNYKYYHYVIIDEYEINDVANFKKEARNSVWAVSHIWYTD